MNIGERIKARREELGMTQKELSEKLGYTSKSTITRIETGSNKLKQDKIAAMAKALETTPDYIMGWDELVDNTPTADELIIKYLSLLNKEGYQEAVKRLEELTQLDKYKKEV